MAFWRKAKKTPAELVRSPNALHPTDGISKLCSHLCHTMNIAFAQVKALETCLRVVTERKEDNEEPDKSVVKVGHPQSSSWCNGAKFLKPNLEI